MLGDMVRHCSGLFNVQLLVGEDDGLALVVADDGGAGALFEEVQGVRGENGHGVHGLAVFGDEGDGVVVETGVLTVADLALVGDAAVADLAVPCGHVADGDVDEDDERDTDADGGNPRETAVCDDKEKRNCHDRADQPDRTAQIHRAEDALFLFLGRVLKCQR